MEFKLNKTQIGHLTDLGYGYFVDISENEELRKFISLVIKGHADALRSLKTTDYTHELLQLMNLPIREFMVDSMTLKIPKPNLANIRILARLLAPAIKNAREMLAKEEILLPDQWIPALTIGDLCEELEISRSAKERITSLRWHLSVLQSAGLAFIDGDLEEDNTLLKVKFSLIDPTANTSKLINQKLGGNQNLLPWIVWNKVINRLIRTEYNSVTKQLVKYYQEILLPMNIAILTIETIKEKAGLQHGKETIRNRVEAARILSPSIKTFLGIGSSGMVTVTEAGKYASAMQWPPNISFLNSMDLWIPAPLLVDITQAAYAFVQAYMLKESIDEVAITEKIRKQVKMSLQARADERVKISS
ncbi:MAG: hypothetical protein ACFFD4_06980 [Candidatus Odinarchaeota archaeon]